MAKYPGEDRRKALCDWLTANGIRPNDVPIDADLTITTEPDGTRIIRYEAFVLDAAGRKTLDERGQNVAIEERTTRLLAEPPAWWQPYEKPTREQLAAELEQARAAIFEQDETIDRLTDRALHARRFADTLPAEQRESLLAILTGRAPLDTAAGEQPGATDPTV